MFQKIKEFISIELGVKKDEIQLISKLEDFGVAGLDFYAFYEEFFEEFEIKNPEEFDTDKYYLSEGLEDIGLTFKAWFSKSARKSLKTKEVTIEHLVKVAEGQKWIDFNPNLPHNKLTDTNIK